jgi:hypothetical protein
VKRALVYGAVIVALLVAHWYIRRADRIARICLDADSSAVSAEDWNAGGPR